MKKSILKITTFVLLNLVIMLYARNTIAEILYHNSFNSYHSFDDVEAFDEGVHIDNVYGFGAGVALEPEECNIYNAGQLRLSGHHSGETSFTKLSYIAIHHMNYENQYSGYLSSLQDTISWSFNLSNMDADFDPTNSHFAFHLASNEINPTSNTQFSYAFTAGGYVGDRMILYRATHTYSPYGNGSEVLIDVPSQNGLSPLPEKGSFRLEFKPSTGVWRLYAEYGPQYVDPKKVSTLLGTVIDDTYVNDYLPYLILSDARGSAYVDNLTVELLTDSELENSAPILFQPRKQLTGLIGEKFRFRPRVEEPDNDLYTLSLKTGPEGAFINKKNRVIWNIPDHAKLGKHYSFIVEATDDKGKSDILNFTVLVTNAD